MGSKFTHVTTTKTKREKVVKKQQNFILVQVPMDFSDGRMFSGGIDYQLDSDTDSEKAQR